MRLARTALALAAVAAAILPGAASACLPPLEGWKPPTLEERVQWAWDHSTDVVYGVVTKTSESEPIPFRVLHVYKGPLKPGATLALDRGWGLDPPMCVGMVPGPPVMKGQFGVIVFHNVRPTMTFLSEEELELMFAKGWIRRAGTPRVAGQTR